ncbi:glyceraldehyde-3-phosphate dehydrogenase, type I [Kwoniella mangroviensis CBS 10435]|uniref:Glyceraldehyde-3-phosphate dehydrogenase, type I n=1 Tax=Kwoniella mangroviensis CBS 10435 TaxID=1331196 RepID=A0A1B9IEA2_9TREE|nr:glyceraldehyde-3-phosphate dehydrogenase, type I [Kwoniella mangroviensis CBS 10435]
MTNMPIAISEQSTLPRVGINGFGRIGRTVGRALFRLLLERDDLLLVAVNHTGHSLEHLMTAIMHDSTHGKFKLGAELSICPPDHSGLLQPTPNNPNPSALVFRGRLIHLSSERDTTRLNWSLAEAEYTMESTGRYTTKKKADLHIKYGKAKVLISAPSKDTLNCVYGVNHHVYEGVEDVLSNASCTTHCLAPVALVLQRAFGVETGMMTTIHASTSSQKVLDGFSTKDIRQGRSAMGNIIPATTGAAQAVVKVLPELAGKSMVSISVRVPVTNVSLVDLTVTLSTPFSSKEELIRPFREAAARRPIQSSTPHPDGPALAGMLGVSDEKLVSSDYLSSTQSSIVDVDATVMLKERTAKIVAWYDNEWGFSSQTCIAKRND